MRSERVSRLSQLVYATAAAALISSFATHVWAQNVSSVTSNFVRLHPAVTLPPNSAFVGALQSSFPMHIVTTLKLRHQSELSAFLSDASHPLLSPAEFEAAYSPTPTQAQAVATFLRQGGFRDVGISANRLLVSADGSAAVVAAAFHTSFAQVLTAHGRSAFANTADVLIPAALQSTVLAVLGVQSVYQMHSFIVYGPPSAAQPLTSGGGTEVGHDPTDFPVIYGASNLNAASNVTVGIITDGSMADAEASLSDFTTANDLPAVSVQVVGSGSGTSGDLEWELDTQDIVAMGGVQNLILYDAPGNPSDSELTTDFNTAVTDDAVKIVNVSLGECETAAKGDGAAASDDQIFEEAVAQGQTFSVASGDSGAYQCPMPQPGTYGSVLGVSYPASSSYVVAVGGTNLYTTNDTTWSNETAWSYSGGGPSAFEPQPAWQYGVYPNSESLYRGVADIAFDAAPASGVDVTIDSGDHNGTYTIDHNIGGTSLASPLFVGAWARILHDKGTGVGFAAPTLYGAASANYASDFHDVTSGNNDGYNAGTGYDYPTGFGSLAVNDIINNIQAAPGKSSFTSYGRLACNGSYLLQWTSVANATSYRVWFRYTPDGTGYNLYGSTTGTNDSVKVPSGEIDYFIVEACTGSTCGAGSNSTPGLQYYAGCPIPAGAVEPQMVDKQQ
ncbi:MAG: S53 family peptidase [Steroidobacteraceae bacterium]